MNLRPKARALIDALATAGLPPFEAGTPDEARALTAALRLPREPRPIALVEDRFAGTVPVRVYADSQAPLATLLYFHGGGWVLGGIDEAEHLARDLATDTGCRVVSVGYRLAPAAPFPAALDDADTALDWVAATYPDQPIVVMGESAGGNIATVAAARARDRGRPAIAGQILAYPVTDAAMNTGSYRAFAEGPLLTAPLMAWFWQHYLADPRARSHPHASPLRADLAGLPPAFVITAEHDVLRDEGEAYAAALDAAGVPTRLRRYPGQIHTFLVLGLSEADDTAMADIAEFLRSTIGKPA
jgi:acetyl esterase